MAVSRALPPLRRYARALTGSQESGDAMAASTLEALIGARSLDEDGGWEGEAGKLALFRAFHLAWSRAGAPLGRPDSRVSARAQGHMAGLTPLSREALLLHAVEGFGPDEIGAIMGVSPDEAGRLIDAAIREMEESVRGRVLLIEDEAVIAMDIAGLVREMGHRVTGVARTHAEAVRLAREAPPDLVLADIQLADGSSGLDAVAEILRARADLPVIFITAFPERLLTGERPEPAFLISKPFGEEQVRSAVSQAMFFSSTETLAA
jgi:CheY-like chemotaxis protein